MNLELLIAILASIKPVVGAALNIHQQLFVSQNYQELLQFINTDEGRVATRNFVDAWRKSKQPTTSTPSSLDL